MGCVKRFYEDCAEAGRVPVSSETLDYLDVIEGRHQLDWIGYTEHEFTSFDGRPCVEDCITMAAARRLIDEGLANDEITFFVESFGDLCGA